MSSAYVEASVAKAIEKISKTLDVLTCLCFLAMKIHAAPEFIHGSQWDRTRPVVQAAVWPPGDSTNLTRWCGTSGRDSSKMDLLDPKGSRTSCYVVVGTMDDVHHAYRELVNFVSCGSYFEFAEMGDVSFPSPAPVQGG